MMKKTSQIICCLAGIFIFVSCLELRNKNGRYLLKNQGQSLDLSIMTFNILSTLDVGSLALGYALWAERKSQVFDLLDEQSPDLVAIEEASSSQFDQFQSYFGKRYQIAHNRAFTPDAFVMFKSDRFELLEKGYWALEEPLDLKIRRLAVWVKVKDKASGRELMFVGTHVDAKDIKIREIKIIKEKVHEQQNTGAPLFLAGDFNLDTSHEGYGMLTGGGWKDSYLGDLEHEVKTFPALNPTRRIDHVFYYGEHTKVLSWQAYEGKKGVVFSDHKAVVVRFHIEKAP